ncbi:methylated-DNA--[protein]-cysteine S-methyltransferase [Mangrovivirga sp. M17]|uniref:Methylated-DNA--protein-cysteine methyltransferase n=1 Tax=Mangrovivirga halotolerans TaxID=2993936 RepID=A0ABT3RPG1_9BACT|nr:methylated-DNA--[protein]-cysteine S-methyltransferase [Mangrovivirga halotolerans]MCX2743233.1 methylated-DNA--[protein]-cysteine S-methyltransferase [Mangrovivirga halotolerans]
MITIRTYESPAGQLLIGSYSNQLCLLDWKYRRMRNAIDKRIKNYFNAEFKEGNSEIIENTISQLNEYFTGKRRAFDIPIIYAGTDFQKSVWKQLLNIPYGKIITYSNLADQLKNPGSIRAVGTANGANAISIIVPCHRVIGKNGELVGYAGGLQVKKELLKLEGIITDQQISLFNEQNTSFL